MADAANDPSPLTMLLEGYLALVEWIPEALNTEAPDEAVLSHHRALVVQLHEHAEAHVDSIPGEDIRFVLANLDNMLLALDSALDLLALLHSDTRLHNLRDAFWTLADRVRTAVHTQMGDRARLEQQKHDILQFLQHLEQHRTEVPAAEYEAAATGIRDMLACLDEAALRSAAPPDPNPLVVCEVVRTGRRGRPSIHINPDFLRQALTMRGPVRLSRVLPCSARTVRRRGQDHGFLQRGAPVFTYTPNPDGTVNRTHRSTTTRVSTLSDEQLDALIASILRHFPNFGRRMLAGSLSARGHNVPRARIMASYVRVHGVTNVFGDRRIRRRTYKVAGPNALWHHDGQHGLIRWRIVFHAFIDGHSRLVTGIRANDNNRGETVLRLFHDACTFVSGRPSRVRGDHGVENRQVARWMEDYWGQGRGSYIWGRSVHNTRIERLWYDLTRGFGMKWKNFFIQLELHDGLDTDQPAHIWLLHHLFLPSIDLDARMWADSWNNHKLEYRDPEGTTTVESPCERFVFGMLEHGPRGMQRRTAPHVDEVEDVHAYGVDFDIFNDANLVAHHMDNNQHDWTSGNPFDTIPPPECAQEVACEPANCPFTAQEVVYLDQQLRTRVDLASTSMDVRRAVWIEGLALSRSIASQNPV